MSFNHTFSAILRGRWLLDKNWADAQMPMVLRMLKGENVVFGNQLSTTDENPFLIQGSYMDSCSARNIYSVDPETNIEKLPGDSIALVTLSGPMVKRGGMCSYGMVDQARLINQLAASPSVSGIIVSIDSPGGQADGTAMLSDAIAAAKTKKPVMAIIDDGMAASAAMWIASAATEIYATQPTDQVGSIGVYTTIADWKSYYKDHHQLTISDVYAPQSTDKNKDYRDAIAGDTSAIEEDLSVLADQFINTVAKNRSGKIKGDAWKTGRMFYAVEAQKIGLIDGIKSFDQVATRLNSLLKPKTQSKSSTMAFEKTIAAAGAQSFGVTDGGFLLSEEHLNGIEAVLSTNEEIVSSNSQLTNQLAQVNQKLSDESAANETLTTHLMQRDGRISELEQEIALLKSGASGQGTHVKGIGQENNDGNTSKVPAHLDDNAGSNAFADRHLKTKKS